jgi:beta-lactamase regulating signal transducer with metallopeptidase domain
MSMIREVVFDLLLNALLQIALFAIAAAAFSRLVTKARAKYQHLFYLGVLLLCLTAPVINTLWHTRSSVVLEAFPQGALREPQSLDRDFWIWKGHGKVQRRLEPGAGAEDVIVAIWGALVLYQLIRFSRGVRRVHRLRRDAWLLSPAEIGMSRLPISLQGVDFLKSTDIANPVTVGACHPAIILPSRLIPALGEHELSAVFAHEYAHICRRDFLVHVVCEVLSLPVALHPGIRYLMSKISQTRELACDEHAASQLGQRHLYAHTLLRLASLCLHAPQGNATGLGIFDGDNLEDRIMTLTRKRKSLSRAGLFGLVLAVSMTFGLSAVLASATSRQALAESSDAAGSFVGTWHWMFQGKSFATMTLARSGSDFTGTVTESRIALNDDGSLSKADASDYTTPKRITTATLEGSTLHVKVADGFEFNVTLKDNTHGEILPAGAPPKMKPIAMERAQ